MEELSKEQLQEVLSAFDFGSPVVGAMRYGKGHINDTFCVHTHALKNEAFATFIFRLSMDAKGVINVAFAITHSPNYRTSKIKSRKYFL